jgi:hypothetical protein
MLITIEISKPFQITPWKFVSVVKNQRAYRVGWLYFAVGVYRCREDELLDGTVEFNLSK